jgi:Carboxypeptidase regulatory-like domain/TonB dependent receptor-like, beta-barrel
MRTTVWLLAAALLPASLAAQTVTTSASLTGRLTDASGSAVAGATVSAAHIERRQAWTALTDAVGRFRFVSLPLGTYRVEVAVAGFAPVARVVTLSVGETLDLPLTIEVAGVTTAVDVTAEPPIVDTTRTQIAGRITPDQVDSLPLNGRNYLDLALLAPGVMRTNTRNQDRFAETSAVPGTGVTVNGQRNLANTIVLDGLSANDDAAGLAGTYLSEDVVRELQMVTSGGIAEFGRASSGVLNIVTKSGTNRLTGRLYGYFRDDALDARNPLATTKDPLNQAQYGGSAGGPLARERTFYFGSVELAHQDRAGFVTITPASVEAVNRVLDGAAYRGPRITTGQFATGYDTFNAFARVDHRAGPHVFMGRYTFYAIESDNARNAGGLNDVSRGTALTTDDHGVALGATTVLSSSLVNELRAQFSRSGLTAPPNDLMGPAVNISGAASFGTATFSPTARDINLVEVADSVSWHAGSHLVKAGAAFLYNDLRIEFPGALQGVYTFQNLAEFARGNYVQFQQAFGAAIQDQSNPNFGLFVQDEWRLSDTLTLNSGLRYDLQNLADPIDTDRDNVAPRIGLAWTSADRRVLVRGSAGLYYDRIPLRAVSNALQRDGVKYKVAVVPANPARLPAFPAVLSEFPSQILTSITTIDPKIDDGLARQVSVEIERALWSNSRLTGTYTHLDGSSIIMSRNVNVPTATAGQGVPNLGRPDPRVANNSQFQSIGQSRYDGVTVAFDMRATAGASLRVSYTLSKAMDDAGNFFFSAPQDNFNVHDDWGPSDNDQRHRVVANGAWEWRGWQLSGIFLYASALPFNVQTGNDRNNDTTVNDRPAGVGRNSERGWDYASLDVRIGRRLVIGSRWTADLMVDAFNVLNRTNLLNPNATFGTGTVPLPSFGRATAAGDPRQLQIGLRLQF